MHDCVVRNLFMNLHIEIFATALRDFFVKKVFFK